MSFSATIAPSLSSSSSSSSPSSSLILMRCLFLRKRSEGSDTHVGLTEDPIAPISRAGVPPLKKGKRQGFYIMHWMRIFSGADVPERNVDSSGEKHSREGYEGERSSKEKKEKKKEEKKKKEKEKKKK